MKHGPRGKKQTLKSASTDLGTTDVGKLDMHHYRPAKHLGHFRFSAGIVINKRI